MDLPFTEYCLAVWRNYFFEWTGVTIKDVLPEYMPLFEQAIAYPLEKLFCTTKISLVRIDFENCSKFAWDIELPSGKIMGVQVNLFHPMQDDLYIANYLIYCAIDALTKEINNESLDHLPG